MDRETPCERAPPLPAGDHRTRRRGREVVSPPIRPTRWPISTRPRIAWRRPVFAGAAIAGRGGRNATPRSWRQVQFGCPARADRGGLRGRREAQHNSSGCVVTWNTLASDCGGGTVVLHYVFPETDSTRLLIDANRHLVEPMNPVFSGITSLIYSGGRQRANR